MSRDSGVSMDSLFISHPFAGIRGFAFRSGTKPFNANEHEDSQIGAKELPPIVSFV